MRERHRSHIAKQLQMQLRMSAPQAGKLAAVIASGMPHGLLEREPGRISVRPRARVPALARS